jgi:sec-independent protein translocase protein TatC
LATKTSERKTFFSRIRNKGKVSEETEMSFFDHIETLRWHIIRSLIAWLVGGVTIFYFVDWVYDNVILAPTHADFVSYGALCRFGRWLHLGDSFCMPPVKFNLQVTEISGTFTSALNIAIIGGIILAFPYVFWELWRFIKPALSSRERKYATGSIFYVSICFFTGVLFGYYLLAPFTFNFLANFTLGKSNTVLYQPTINDYIDSLTNLLLGCGIAFELPVLSYVLARVGIITGSFLKRYFKFAFVVILIVSAIITPSPDWTSQFLVAIPLLFLYWISILLAGRVERKRAKEEKEWS